MVKMLKVIADSPWFNHFIIAVILVAGVVVGFETYSEVAARYQAPLDVVNGVVLFIFVVEIIIKMGAEGRQPWRYFLDPWNIFDFAIVAVAFMPIDASYVTVLRLLRLLRVLKLVRAIPRLQILVGALLHAIPSMFYVSVLLFLLFYVYACAATFLFSANDPVHFSALHLSMLSLFRIVTLEDWTDVMYINMYGCDQYGYGPTDGCTDPSAAPVMAALFFVSFVMLGTMIVLNLFIGVIMTGIEHAQTEAESHHHSVASGDAKIVRAELGELRNDLRQLVSRLDVLHGQLASGDAFDSVESKKAQSNDAT